MLRLSSTFWVLAVALVSVLAPVSAQAQQWGSLKGTFKYDGKAPAPVKLQVPGNVQLKAPLYDETLVVAEDGGLANVVVYLRSKDVMIHPDYEKLATTEVKMDNANFRFNPHITSLRVSQPLVFTNSDGQSHNANYQPLGDQGANPLIVPGQNATPYKHNRAQTIPQKVSCSIHAWMNGYVLARPDPYHAVSGPDGSFEIKNLPVGELEFQIWHERAGYLAAKPEWVRGRATITIKAGENSLGEIKVKPTLFK